MKSCEKERCRLWKVNMERTMKEGNDWDHNVEGDVVEGAVVCVSRGEVVQTINKIKTKKESGSTDVSL